MDRPRRSSTGPAARIVGRSVARTYSHSYRIVTYSRRPHYSIHFPKYHLGKGCDAFPFFRWDLRRQCFSPPRRPSRSSGQQATPSSRPQVVCSSIIGGWPPLDNDYPLPARGPPLSSTPASFLFAGLNWQSERRKYPANRHAGFGNGHDRRTTEDPGRGVAVSLELE